MREECKGCIYLKTLNPHHIVDGKPYETCVKGEVPETCLQKQEEERV